MADVEIRQYRAIGDRVRHKESGTAGTIQAFWVVWDDHKSRPNETGPFCDSVLETSKK